MKNLHRVKDENALRNLLDHSDRNTAIFAGVVLRQTFKIHSAKVDGSWWSSSDTYTLKIETMSTGNIHTLKILKSAFEEHIVDANIIVPSETMDYRVTNVGTHVMHSIQLFARNVRFAVKNCEVMHSVPHPCYSFTIVNKWGSKKQFTVPVDDFSSSVVALARENPMISKLKSGEYSFREDGFNFFAARATSKSQIKFMSEYLKSPTKIFDVVESRLYPDGYTLTVVMDGATWFIDLPSDWERFITPVIDVTAELALHGARKVLESIGYINSSKTESIVVNKDGTLTINIKTDAERKRVINQLQNMVLNHEK